MQLVLLKSMDGADAEWYKEVKGNIYDIVVEGFQLLSKWTARIWEQCAWKFSRPCKDAVPSMSHEMAASFSDYEKVFILTFCPPFLSVVRSSMLCLVPFVIVVLFGFLMFLYAKDLFDVILTFLKLLDPSATLQSNSNSPLLSILLTILSNNKGNNLHVNHIQIHGISNKQLANLLL